MYKFLSTFVLICVFSFGEAVQYQVHSLDKQGTLSFPVSINDRCEVVGYISESFSHVFYWSPETGLTIINQIPENAFVIKINNQGQVAGHFWSLDGFWSEKYRLHAYVWSLKEGFRDLGVVDAKNSETKVLHIDDEGTILTLTNQNWLYLWNKGKFETLIEFSEPPTTESGFSGIAMNHRKQLAFIKKVVEKNQKVTRAFFLDLNTKELKPLLDDEESTPFIYALNNEGEVIGTLTYQGSKVGFIKRRDGELEWAEQFFPLAINDQGQVVGQFFEEGIGYGAILEPGTIFDINGKLAPGQGQELFTISGLRGINNQGDLIGWIREDKKYTAVILRPEKIENAE